ncbi:siderophore biosynthesis protein [Lentzea sp. NBRC 105346]|uniref:MupA/Atu3671 family FMN-dependent luciferase-like monooxygenase n=1 Tax=Lentzea sp. NBRC 105346 TaxID=3032205 RepID=UPI0024A02B3E|nr:MupA/Atu3671 family FMN-dependent luciferase-like monooxygenase [Lentzea sp. NBRC 105346]GLZ29516.1 siderophore biosynthesis protein [Lentzea sp. NBRC 105346]
MDFSLFYFAHDSSDNDRYRLLLDGATFADTHGFTAVWTPERHFHPFGGLYPNPSVTAAAIAGRTERVAIRAGSVVAPLHHPARIAEEWSMVDNLSGGRVGIAFASGWNADDFVLNPSTFSSRRSSVQDAVRDVRRLWRGEPVPFPNGLGEVVDVRVYPRPVQAELPVWITSSGSLATFETAGSLGVGVLTHLLGQDLDELAGKLAAYRAALPLGNPGHVVLMLHTFVGDDVKELVRQPFTDYLRGSLDLFLPPDVTLSDADVEWMLGQAFERYYTGGSLLGTVPENLEMLDRLTALGVDEVACLIDFGLDTKQVLDGLTRLDELRRSAR